ncbi:MAG: TerC family protein [Elusimicrobiota bacterium]|jgi:tellurite resistance protein TerC|nr:TerC family protein [Elusimicrobiota bacterium]
MAIDQIMWIVFWITVGAALFVDLALLNKRGGKVSVREAAFMVLAWVSLALLFGGAVALSLGHEKALDYLTGYVIEYSLSVDNMFVFIMIFGFFSVPSQYQPKALLWGILGAVALRFFFIFVGVSLITNFKFMVYVFGALLIYTAVKMLCHNEDKFDPSDNMLLKTLKRIMPVKETYHGGAFFVREKSKLYATPLFAALLVIEGSDVVFAVDSIPAVLSVTHDAFVVYTSNIFAVIGLRSLYFLLAGMADKFRYLKYGIAAVLIFVGLKMAFSHYYHVPTWISLTAIAAALATAVIASAAVKTGRKI